MQQSLGEALQPQLHLLGLLFLLALPFGKLLFQLVLDTQLGFFSFVAAFVDDILKVVVVEFFDFLCILLCNKLLQHGHSD